MGFLDKIKFWKKDDFSDINFDKPIEVGTPGFGPEKNLPTYEESMSMTRNPMMQNNQQSYENQELKLLISKMDTMLAKMDNMNQRIANLERIAEEAQR